MSDPLGDAFEGLLDAVRDGAAFVRGHSFYGDDENRAAAYMFLVHMLLSGTILITSIPTSILHSLNNIKKESLQKKISDEGDRSANDLQMYVASTSTCCWLPVQSTFHRTSL